MKLEDLFERATKIVRGDRHDEYDDFKIMMERTAQVWTGILGYEVSDVEVALMMAGLKLVRAQQNAGKADSWIDAVGYLAIGAECFGMMDVELEEHNFRQWVDTGDLPVPTEAVNDRE